MKNTRWLLLLGVILGMFLSACQAGAGNPEIVIENAWGRPSPKVATTGAFYMVIKNTGGEADRLIAGTSPACQTIELHESYDIGDGVMGMRRVEGGFIDIPARGQAELKMGGIHMMCIEKLDDFEDGKVLSLTLEFEKSGSKPVDIEIRQPDM